MIIDANPNVDNADPIFKAIKDKNYEELKYLLEAKSNFSLSKVRVSVEATHSVNMVGYALLQENYEALKIMANFAQYNKNLDIPKSNWNDLFQNALNQYSATEMVVEILLDPENKLKGIINIKEKSKDMLKNLIEIGQLNPKSIPIALTLELCSELLQTTHNIQNILNIVKALPEREEKIEFLVDYYLNEAKVWKGDKNLEEKAIKNALHYALSLENEKLKESVVKKYLFGDDVSQKIKDKLPENIHNILTRGYDKETVLEFIVNIKSKLSEKKNRPA